MSDDARRIWQEKLDFLLVEEAKTADAEQKFALKQRIAEARAKLAELGAVGVPSPPTVSLHLPAGDGEFLGRAEELAWLDAAWADSGRTHVAVLVAAGGVGKTTLVKRWLDYVKADGWRGARRVYGWSFYSQGTSDDRQASDDSFLSEALGWFRVAHEASRSAADKGRLLGEALSRERVLLVLDGVEPLQYPPGAMGGRLRAPGVEALLDHVAGAGAPGLVVLTTREPLVDLREHERRDDHPAGGVVSRDLGNLDEADGARLLHRLGVRRAGAGGVTDDDDELREASREVRGHALALSLLGRYLALAYDGDVRRRDQVSFVEADAEVRGGHALKVMAAYERWLERGGESGQRVLAVARLLGLFDRPAEVGCLEALRAEPPIAGLTDAVVGLSAARWKLAVNRLAECGLVLRSESASAALDAHPLVREHFARQLREQRPEAWREGHRRLYEHLKASVPHHPEGLAGLQPLYQAVAHGCHAGLHQHVCNDVYVDRILRGTGADGFYSTRKLGTIGADLGAVTCFFEQPWSRLVPGVPQSDQAWLLNQAAVRLRGLGRLTEALEPACAGLVAAVRTEDWQQAALSASNVSGLELALGDATKATRTAELSVAHADRSGYGPRRIASRTVLAEALHQAGRRSDASASFIEAEALQAEREPPYPLLFALQGFRYCELLLATAERAAARVTAIDRPRGAANMGALDEVAQRMTKMLEWRAAGDALLDVALDELTLARAALYRALLDPLSTSGAVPIAREHIAAAVTGLRAAGMTHHLPRGLLTRAWVRAVDGDPDGARADLDEARRIAERGSMRLHLADVHLHRARLFHDKQALKEARRLIEECGYHRRDEELQDAEEAATTWPDPQATPRDRP